MIECNHKIVITMREIFKYKTGKDFYRDSLEYLEYNKESFQNDDNGVSDYIMDDDEISFYVMYKKKKNNKK
jgi:hypothetical protein